MGGTILRAQVYELIHSGEPFDMIWITADRRRGTGGDIITAEGWMKLQRTGDHEGNPSGDPSEPGIDISKDPHHLENGTVNVFNPANPGQRPYKVHYDLIQFFNGKRVIN